MFLLFGGREFCFIYIRFELPLMNPCGGVDEAAGSKDLKSWEIWIQESSL